MTSQRTVELGSGHIAQDPGIGHDDLGDPAPGSTSGERSPEVLDVGKLGHGFATPGDPSPEPKVSRMRIGWPGQARELEEVQSDLARSADSVTPWRPPVDAHIAIGGLFVASSISGPPRCWVGACVVRDGRALGSIVVSGEPAAPYLPGHLALREGPVLERAVRRLDVPFDVLLVNATGRDHPRGAGLALHLGAVVDVPTVGVTDRPLLAEAAGRPGSDRGSSIALVLEGEVVGHVVRTQTGARPVVAHAGWRTDAEVARSVVLAAGGTARTPEPIRQARHVARLARAAGEGRLRRI
jgi:deoxyribonuclease V